MLVRLYELPELAPAVDAARASGVAVVRAKPEHAQALAAWVHERFSSWGAELGIALSQTPATCFVATAGTPHAEIVGFACYDATCPNFFGPMGVDPASRGLGAGRALVLSALHAQAAQGYGYAIIGGVGPAGFYERTVGATLIAGSDPGIYRRARASGPGPARPSRPEA